MEKLSRVKKYEKLRESINGNASTEVDSKSIIKEYNQKVDEAKKVYTPSHEKNIINTMNINEYENKDTNNDEFKNEYLDSFIQEVREYNIQNGNREHEDTKLDILSQLNSKNKEKRSRYLEKVEETSVSAENNDEIYNTREISRQVFDLLNDDNDNKELKVENVKEEIINDPITSIQEEKEVENDALLKTQKLEDRIAMLESQLTSKEIVAAKKENTSIPKVDTDSITKKAIEEEELSRITKEKLLEETTNLKIKMDEYKGELNEINSGIDSNNRLLNIIITVLIVALLAVIGVVVYWLVSGGII